MSEDMKPEIGDLVDYGVAIFNPDGSVKFPAPRGTISYIYKDGSISVAPHSGAPKQRLNPGEFFILSKAG